MDSKAHCPALPRLEDLPFAHDREAAWNELLTAGPVAVSEAGVYFLSGADVVEQAATNTEIFSSQGAGFDKVGSPFPLVPIAFDRPEHTRYRRTLDKFFGPRRMAEREPVLRDQVGALIDAIKVSGGTCDVVSELAIPFPSQVFLTLFGLPLDDLGQLLEWKDAILQFSAAEGNEASPETLERAGAMVQYLQTRFEERRGGGGEDLLSLLINDPGEDALTELEVIGLCFLFVIAGLDTVTSAVGFALYELARDQVLQQRLRSDEAAIPAFVEEVLRVGSSIPYAPRRTTADVEVAGVTIPAGSPCWLGFGAANWDARRFADPSTIHSAAQNHFAFGRGPHRCLGSHLARIELKLIVEEWNRRIPAYSLVAEPVIEWPHALLRYKELHLRLDS
ncbi:cytochrome P450 [Mycolicibacterium rhodesiae JS60]|nr:cytochrome P450 [Mycolicibacterium rhodesiae JS60]